MIPVYWAPKAAAAALSRVQSAPIARGPLPLAPTIADGVPPLNGTQPRLLHERLLPSRPTPGRLD